jgi:hypothetical protein
MTTLDRGLRLVLSVSLLWLAALNAAAAEPAEKVFRAGAYAADINPTSLPISVNGGMTDRLAKSIHDPLHARCLVLDDGRTKLAIVVCDSCMIPRDVLDEAKRLAEKSTGIPSDKMLISATHTHEAPTAGPVFQSNPDPAYLQHLSLQIAKGIDQAAKNLVPAQIGWGVGQNDKQVFNRRWYLKPGAMPPNPFGKTDDQVKMNPGVLNPNLVKPAGPIDPDVSIVSLRTAAGKPLALLANYSLHYVGGVEPLSADYFGAFAERIGQLLEADRLPGADKASPPFVGIMSNGTSGDINNVDVTRPMERKGSFEQARYVADSVAQTAYDTYQKIDHRNWVPLAMVEREIELGVRVPSAADVAEAKAQLAKAGEPPYKALGEFYARETVFLAEYPATVKAKLQAIRIGELGIVSSPCETFVEIGLALKQKSPLKPLFTIELANGYNGYLPTPEQFDLGGYETWRARSSYLERDAATKISATLVDLLGIVSK